MSHYHKTKDWQRLSSPSHDCHSLPAPPVVAARADPAGLRRHKLCPQGSGGTYSMSGQLSGFSSSPPSMTKRSTCSLVMPWYGCSASVAISQSTTPKDLQGTAQLQHSRTSLPGCVSYKMLSAECLWVFSFFYQRIPFAQKPRARGESHNPSLKRLLTSNTSALVRKGLSYSVLLR